MRKNFLFFAGGVLAVGFVDFGLRYFDILQSNVPLLIFNGVLGTALAVWGLFAKGRKGG